MWIYNPESSHSAPASEDSISASSKLFQELERSVTWRGNTRSARSWYLAWKRGTLSLLPSSLISGSSTQPRGETKSVSSQQDIPVSPSASVEGGVVQQMLDIFGPTSKESSKSAAPNSSYLRMSMDTEVSEVPKSFATLPLSGSLSNGQWSELQMLEPRTSASDSSLWATPVTRDWKDGCDPSPKAPTKGHLGRQAPRVTGAVFPGETGLRLNPRFAEALMGFRPGWTAFGPSETQCAPNKQRTPSKD